MIYTFSPLKAFLCTGKCSILQAILKQDVKWIMCLVVRSQMIYCSSCVERYKWTQNYTKCVAGEFGFVAPGEEDTSFWYVQL